MFYYVSFLKPPPLQSNTFGSISITPQISNDLRTEPFPGEQDLFFSWSPCVQSSFASTTKPNKLTTWRPLHAYKEIPVPLPGGIREGQSWQLILSGQGSVVGQTNSECVDLGRKDVGRAPFPVISLPILFSSKGRMSQAKQEKIERLYVLPSDLESKQGTAALKFTEQTSFDLDKKIWDSGIGLASWLAELKQAQLKETRDSQMFKMQDIQRILFSSETKTIVELGAGIGIVSVALAALRASTNYSEQEKDRIFATDLPSAMVLLEQNISSNANCFSSNCIPEAMVLDWDDDGLPREIQNLKHLDAIVMADVTYNTSSFPSLLATLEKLLKIGSKPPLVLLGYKERDASERTWLDLALDIGYNFEQIGRRPGAGDAPVEIWAGFARLWHE